MTVNPPIGEAQPSSAAPPSGLSMTFSDKRLWTLIGILLLLAAAAQLIGEVEIPLGATLSLTLLPMIWAILGGGSRATHGNHCRCPCRKPPESSWAWPCCSWAPDSPSTSALISPPCSTPVQPCCCRRSAISSGPCFLRCHSQLHCGWARLRSAPPSPSTARRLSPWCPSATALNRRSTRVFSRCTCSAPSSAPSSSAS